MSQRQTRLQERRASDPPDPFSTPLSHLGRRTSIHSLPSIQPRVLVWQAGGGLTTGVFSVGQEISSSKSTSRVSGGNEGSAAPARWRFLRWTLTRAASASHTPARASSSSGWHVGGLELFGGLSLGSEACDWLQASSLSLACLPGPDPRPRPPEVHAAPTLTLAGAVSALPAPPLSLAVVSGAGGPSRTSGVGGSGGLSNELSPGVFHWLATQVAGEGRSVSGKFSRCVL